MAEPYLQYTRAPISVLDVDASVTVAMMLWRGVSGSTAPGRMSATGLRAYMKYPCQGSAVVV